MDGGVKIMKPIIKWAGGKGGNLSYIRELLPENFNTYYEPFAGGLAVLLDLSPTNFTINDINSELINVYTQIRDNVEDVIKHLTKLDKQHEAWPNPKEYFYEIRLSFNKHRGVKSADQAARFIYLNKHCFNGLYRVNSKGEFNVPFGKKLKVNTYEGQNIGIIHAYLNFNNIKILSIDFEEAVKDAKEGDFIYFDPPYDSDTYTFNSYTEDGFSKDEQIRLSNVFKNLSDRGCYVMLSNHNTILINELYKDFYIHKITAKRNINSNGKKRGKVEEVIITNYEIDLSFED